MTWCRVLKVNTVVQFCIDDTLILGNDGPEYSDAEEESVIGRQRSKGKRSTATHVTEDGSPKRTQRDEENEVELRVSTHKPSRAELIHKLRVLLFH